MLSHFRSLMATGVQIGFFMDDRTLGLMIGHLITPLYTSPKAPSPKGSSIMISLAGISQLSGRGVTCKVVEHLSNIRVFDRPWKIGSYGSYDKVTHKVTYSGCCGYGIHAYLCCYLHQPISFSPHVPYSTAGENQKNN